MNCQSKVKLYVVSVKCQKVAWLGEGGLAEGGIGELQTTFQRGITRFWYEIPLMEYNKENLTKHNECMLLGFKDSLPVYQDKTRMSTKNTAMGNIKDDTQATTAAAAANTKVLNVKVDPITGEKFIVLNGKRIRMASFGETKTQSNQSTLSFRVEKTTSLPRISTCTRITQADNGKFENIDKTPQVNKDKVMNTISSYVPKSMGNPVADHKDSSDSTIVVIKCKNEKCELANKLKVNVPDPTKYCKNMGVIECEKTDTLKMELLASNVVVTDTKQFCETKKTKSSIDCSVETDITLEHMSVLLKKNTSISTSKEVQTDIQIHPNKEVNENLGCYSPLEELVSCFSPRGLDELLNMPADIEPFSGTPKPDKSKMEKNFFKELHAALIADEKGNMPIHQAVIMNNLKKVERSACILRVLSLPEYIDLKNVDELTPLCLAVMHGASTDVISFLLSEGAKLNCVDSEGNTVLHLAIEFQRDDALETLLCHEGPNLNLNAVNHKGSTPLIMCCMSDNYSCADLLLQHGADPNVKDGNSGRTALFHAVETGNEELVKLLLKYNADTKEKNFFGTSPHDAMFEIEVSASMKKLILGKQPKRRIAEDAALRGTVVVERRRSPHHPSPPPPPQNDDIRILIDRAKIRTYPSLKRIKKNDYNSYSAFLR